MELPKNLLSGFHIAPDFYLCESDKTLIGGINVTEANGTFKFNTYSEITCQFHRLYTHPVTGKSMVHPLYDKVEALRVLYIVGFGYYQIQQASINADGIDEYKEITAYSLEYEMTQKYLEDFVINMGTEKSIDGVQLYNTDDTSKSLIHLVLEKMPGWKPGHIDESLIKLQRSFEVDRQAIYDFIMNDMSKTFKLVAIFDTYHRTVNLYEEDKAGKETNIYVALDTLGSNAKIDYSADDIKTCLYVYGADDLTIREVNLGLPYILNIDYYNTIDWLGQDLYDAYQRYTKKIDANREPFSKLMLQWDDLYNQKSKLYNAVPDYDENNDQDIPVVGSFAELPTPSIDNVYKVYKVSNASGGTFYYICKAKIVGDNTEYEWVIDIDNISSFGEFPEPDIQYVGGVYKVYNTIQSNGVLYYICESYKGENNKTEYRWVLANKDYGINLLKEKEAIYLSIQEVQVSAGWAESTNSNHHRYEETYKKLTDVQAELHKKQAEADKIDAEMNKITEQMGVISKDIEMQNNFTEAQMIRLSPFIREDEYKDDCFLVNELDNDRSSLDVKKELLAAAEKELTEKSQPQLAFTMDMANILAMPEFEPVVKDFDKGNYIKVEIRPGYVVKTQILEVKINFDDLSDFSVTFGNLSSLYSQIDIHAQLLSSAVTAGKSVASNSSYWQKGADKATTLDKKLDEGLLDANTSIRSNSINQAISIDQYGIHLRKYKDGSDKEYDDEQIWMTNNMINFSSDGFKTSKMALGKVLVAGEYYYGLIAEMLIGGIVQGSKIVGSTIQIGEREDGTYAFEINNQGQIIMRGDDGETIIGGSITDGFTSVRIVVDSGSTYFTDTTQSATLSCHVYFGGSETTSKYADTAFSWIRSSDDAAADSIWNSHHTGMKSIVVTPSDIEHNAQFYCTVDI